MNATETLVKGIDSLKAEVKGLRDRIEPAEAALKALAEPASKAGVTPALLFSQLSKAHGGLGVAGDGAAVFLPRPHGQPLTKSARSRPWYGQLQQRPEVEFGTFLKAFHAYVAGGAQDARLRGQLSEWGTQKTFVGDGGTIEKAALAESSGVAGGYVIPPQFAESLLMLAMEQSILEPRCSHKTLASRSLTLPSLDVTTAYGAGRPPALGGVQAFWESEATTFQESEPQFRQTELTAWLMGFYSLASNTLLADAQGIGLDSLLTQLFTMAIAFYRDYYFFQGTGVGQPLGVLNCPAAIQVTRNQTGHFNWLDVGQMLSKIYWPLTGSDTLIWVIHPSVLPDLLRMNDMSGSQAGAGFGRLVFQPYDRGAQAAVGTGVKPVGGLMGSDVYVSEKVPALGTLGDVSLVACQQYLVGERLELQIELSTQVKFLQNQSAWRVLTRVDGQPWLNQAVTLADGSYQVSFAALLK